MSSKKRQIVTGISLIILTPIVSPILPLIFGPWCIGTPIAYGCQPSILLLAFPVSIIMLILGIVLLVRGVYKK